MAHVAAPVARARIPGYPPDGMKEFLRENWLFIVLPAAVVLGVVIWLLVSGGGSDNNFHYPLY